LAENRTYYNLFGLGVASELDLPLPHSIDAAEVEVVLGPVPVAGVLLFEAEDPFPFACYQLGEMIVLAWTGIRFGVVPGRVVVDTEDHRTAAHLLVPAVWSVVLSTHQRESLHGSAVEQGGHAVAILGLSGSGKTTAAHLLIKRGWRLVSDDLLTFDDDLLVIPGPPWMRFVSGDGSGLPTLPDAGGKVRAHPPTSPQPVPLAAMIIMAHEYERCVRLSGTAAAVALLQQVYNPILTHPGQVQRRFDLVHDLVNRIPIYGAPPRSMSAEQILDISEETTV
jgi:hypothetical protein